MNRIAVLTAGPTALTGTSGPSSSQDNNNQSLLFSQAMAVSCLQEDEKLLDEVKQDQDENWKIGVDANNDNNVVNRALRGSLVLSDGLTKQWKHATSLRLALLASINIAEDISQAHADLIRHSGELSAAADRLQEQAAALEQHAIEMGRPLEHYDAVDRIGILVGVLFKNNGKVTVRGLAKIQVDAEDFPNILQQIDEAILYFGKESGGAAALAELQKQQQQHHHQQQQQQQHLSGNLEYYRRALVLQEAALFLIREAVADRIQTTTQQIFNALQGNNNNNPGLVVQADQLEASLIYTRFHGISNRSNRLVTLAKTRLQKLSNQYSNSDHVCAGYYELLQTCRTTYCNCRETLLRPTVRSHMEQLYQLHGPTGMTRLASVFLIRLCTIETALFNDFFGEADRSHKNQEFQAALAQLCSEMHRTLRRSMVTLTDLDILCQIVSVLREEGIQAAKQNDTLAAARATIHLTEDAQERLIFCANRQLQKEVIRFKATPKDLDYPNKLLQLRERQTIKQPPPQTTTSNPGEGAELIQPNEEADAQEQLNLVYESWFPPMRTVLRILSKIFRVVETRVFEDLALTSVQACIKALKEGATFIKAAKSLRDADLFLVKHLLILREQLSPFDMELRTVERQLDFSDAGKAVAKFLANRNRRLLSMSTENAVLTLLREGVSVQESSVDSKRDLEEALRSACNDFIDHVVQTLGGSLVTFVAERNGTTRLKDSPDVVNRVLQETLDNIQSLLPGLQEQMALYLDNVATQGILLKPATKKILKATEEVKKWIANTVDHHWNSETKTRASQIAAEIEPAIKNCLVRK